MRYHSEVWYLTKLTFQELKAHNVYCLYTLLVRSAVVTYTVNFGFPPRAHRCSQMFLLIYDLGTETPSYKLLDSLLSSAMETWYYCFRGGLCISTSLALDFPGGYWGSWDTVKAYFSLLEDYSFKKRILPITSDWVVCYWGDYIIFIPYHLLDGSNKNINSVYNVFCNN